MRSFHRYNWNLVLCDTGKSGWGWDQNALVRVDSKTKTYRYNGEWQTVRRSATQQKGRVAVD